MIGAARMSIEKLSFRNEPMQFEKGTALGCSYRWPGGQYCAFHTDRGIFACGIYDCHIASEFGLVVAVARGTPANPLCEPEDLLKARVAEVSEPARRLGIEVGMLGSDALDILLTK
jgi:uncharacterized protein YunC (DUF1805 family)